jgi:hypothetical protein
MADEFGPDALAARVTAIQLIVEGLLADHLAADSDPQRIGKAAAAPDFWTVG